ncbi:MAG TPA: ribosome-associated translation inhibitor RaiA [Alphaproteobacteria bacterium]|nr:ribosome-associated translation inhibitor RaiA [Alphaproteobacteria bacterium]HAJ46753.1 ribosome-associated translation inhibitor RaiA [Alphaproteobacteria bacterium]
MDPLQLTIAGRQIDIGDALRSHARARLTTLATRYLDAGVDGSVNFIRDGSGYRTDCTLHLRSGLYLHTHGRSPDIYASFDQAAERLEKRLSRYKGRIRDHHGGAREALPMVPARDVVFQAPDPDAIVADANEPVVVSEATTQLRSLTVSEAVMQLDLADGPVVVFKNAAHGHINVVYRRADGHIGWIDPTLVTPSPAKAT